MIENVALCFCAIPKSIRIPAAELEGDDLTLTLPRECQAGDRVVEKTCQHPPIAFAAIPSFPRIRCGILIPGGHQNTSGE